jgi:hypothetical protein
MLPMSHAWKEGSMMDLIETTPKMELVIHASEPLVEALRDSHALYSPLLQRRAQREAAHTYLQGLLAELPRQSIEPLVRALEGVHPHAVRAMHAFISAGTWDDAALLLQHGKEVEQDRARTGGPEVDSSDSKAGRPFRWGETSIIGELASANRQAGVFVGDIHPSYTLLDRQLSARRVDHGRRVC